MPQGDRTGPTGMGPMMGRSAGYCAGYGTPGYVNPVPGHGFGRGFGRCRGFRVSWRQGRHHTAWSSRVTDYMPYARGAMAPAEGPTREEEKLFLQGQVEILQGQLSEIRKQLDDLNK